MKNSIQNLKYFTEIRNAFSVIKKIMEYRSGLRDIAKQTGKVSQIS